MQRGLIVFFFISLALVCRAQNPLPAWDSDSQKAWWTQNPTPDSWPKAAKDLQTQLEASYKKDGASCFSQADFQGWMEHLEWIELGVASSTSLADADNLKTFIALGKDESISHLFVKKLDPRDNKKQALQKLILLAQANLDDLHEYAALGVAYSLVFDQAFPWSWPHNQVAQAAVPIGNFDVVERFNFYVQANRNKKTALDLTQITVENLKFLVDSEVKLSELEYAQKSHISYSHFGDAFFSIKYDESRVKPNENIVFNWPGKTYLLSDIEKMGGICVDQAYYASILGKGRGIPTIFFHGQGTGGGHAWFGYLSSSGKWELDCGRYASQNYPKGYAIDPQTWQGIDDTVLTNLFKTGAKNSNYQSAMTALAWARLHVDDPSCRQILDDARSIMPEWAGTWKMEGALLELSNVDLDQKKAFYQAWITQFTTFPEMKVAGQQHLLAALKQANDPEAENLQRSIIMANRSEGFDLGIQGSTIGIMEKMDAKDWDGAKLDYQKAIRDFADQGGGTLLLGLIVPYVETCLKDGQVHQAKEGIKFTEDRMFFEPDSITARTFDDLKKKVDAAKISSDQPAAL